LKILNFEKKSFLPKNPKNILKIKKRFF